MQTESGQLPKKREAKSQSTIVIGITLHKIDARKIGEIETWDDSKGTEDGCQWRTIVMKTVQQHETLSSSPLYYLITTGSCSSVINVHKTTINIIQGL